MKLGCVLLRSLNPTKQFENIYSVCFSGYLFSSSLIDLPDRFTWQMYLASLPGISRRKFKTI